MSKTWLAFLKAVKNPGIEIVDRSRLKVMARYLLDTNMLAFIISGEYDDVSPDIKALMADYANQL